MSIVNPLDLDTLTLREGKHDSPADGMCFIEAAAYMAGEPFTDRPACVSLVVAAFGRSWNDALPDDATRTRLLGPLVPLTIGTATTAEDEQTRAWMATDWLVRVQTPAWLRLAGLTVQADLLAGMVPLSPETTPSLLGPIRAVRQDADAARDAAGAAARDAARDAARAPWSGCTPLPVWPVRRGSR